MRTILLSAAAVLAASSVLAADPARAADPAGSAPPERPVLTKAYQGRGGGEQSERFSRRIKVGRNGWLTLSNISGDITVTGGGGDEIVIDAVKHGRDRDQLGSVQIRVNEGPGRVEVSTDHMGRSDHASVDYTVTVPTDAGVDLRSVSGDIKVTGVQGSVRAESVSGDVTTAKTPRLERVKSVSGDVDVTDAAVDGDLTAGSVSGSLTARGLKARGLDLNTVSGEVSLTDVTAERVGIRSVSGDITYEGPLAKNGRYDLNTHSGDVHLELAGNTGFEVNANSFSGSIRSDVPLTMGATGRSSEGRRGGRGESMHATYGDGSAVLTIRTFSGDVVISKR